MKIYLDTCSLQRPLDSKIQIRVALEAEAILGVLALCESGKVDLISSEVLVFEVDRNPSLTRKEYALEALSQAKLFIALNERIENRARELNINSVKPLDALHLASAEEAQADYFCTCDDKLLNKMKSLKDIKVRVVSPIELVEEVEKWQ
jgi:Predicted nucleic acid-binding protein, contains PIN domain